MCSTKNLSGNLILALANIAILRANNSSQYQINSQVKMVTQPYQFKTYQKYC